MLQRAQSLKDLSHLATARSLRIPHTLRSDIVEVCDALMTPPDGTSHTLCRHRVDQHRACDPTTHTHTFAAEMKLGNQDTSNFRQVRQCDKHEGGVRCHVLRQSRSNKQRLPCRAGEMGSC